MSKVEFLVGGHLTRSHNVAYVLDGEEPLEALVEAAIDTVSTGIEVTCGGVTLHLAAWQDPDHWSEDWEAQGITDVAEFVAALTQGEER